MPLSPEDEKIIVDAKAARIAADEEKESFIFLSRHQDFVRCQANGGIMKALLAAKGYPWNASSMEAIWGDADNRAKFVKSAPVAPAPPAQEEPPAPVVEETYGIDADTIAKWTRWEMKEALADPKKKVIVNRVLAEFSQANPGVDPRAFNRSQS